MRRPAKLSTLAIALITAPLAAALATASTPAPPAPLSTIPSSLAAAVVVSPDAPHPHPHPNPNTVHPNTGQWVFVTDVPNELWICQYEGNQLVESGKYVNYECLAGPPGQLALWGLTA
jgi:hypothetical protein